MAKPAARAYSRYSRDAIVLLGQMIRLGRINRAQFLAQRLDQPQLEHRGQQVPGQGRA